jgi:hypothetical protein
MRETGVPFGLGIDKPTLICIKAGTTERHVQWSGGAGYPARWRVEHFTSFLGAYLIQ